MEQEQQNPIQEDFNTGPASTQEQSVDQEGQKSPEQDRQRPDDNESSSAIATLRETLMLKLEQNTDIAALAQTMDEIMANFPPDEVGGQMKSFLEAKADVLGIDKSRSEALSQEIMTIETEIISSLKSELADKQAIESVRETFYKLAISNIISGEKICNLLTSINYRENPGAEAGENAPAFQGMSCAYIANGDSREFYIYKPFLSESKTAQLTIISHEVGHLLEISTNLFDQAQYAKFQDFARDPTDEKIAEMEAENPQFAYLLRVIKEPTAHLPMWNAYIRNRLKKLETITDAEALSRERVAMSHELVAEMIGSYICAGENNATYFLDQIKYSKPKDVIAYIKNLSGCDQDDQFVAFYQQNGVDLVALRNSDSSEILAKLSQIPQLSIIFGSSASWREMLEDKLSDRGDALQPNTKTAVTGELVDENGFVIGTSADLARNYSPISRQDATGTNGAGSGDNAFEKIWDFLTGTGTHKKVA